LEFTQISGDLAKTDDVLHKQARSTMAKFYLYHVRSRVGKHVLSGGNASALPAIAKAQSRH
jgi:hypothetical protein